MFNMSEGDIYSYGPMKNGKWYVRDCYWAGKWDTATGELISGNTIEEVDTESEAMEIANRMNEEERNHVSL